MQNIEFSKEHFVVKFSIVQFYAVHFHDHCFLKTKFISSLNLTKSLIMVYIMVDARAANECTVWHQCQKSYTSYTWPIQFRVRCSLFVFNSSNLCTCLAFERKDKRYFLSLCISEMPTILCTAFTHTLVLYYVNYSYIRKYLFVFETELINRLTHTNEMLFSSAHDVTPTVKIINIMDNISILIPHC